MGKLLAHTERMLAQKMGMQHDRTLADRAVAAVMESLEARAAQGRIPGISMQTAQELCETAAALQRKVEESTRGIRAFFPEGLEGPLSSHFLDMEQSQRRLSVTQKMLAAIVDGLSKAPSDQPSDGQTEGSSKPTPPGGRRQTVADTVDSENLQKAPEQSLETLGSGKPPEEAASSAQSTQAPGSAHASPAGKAGDSSEKAEPQSASSAQAQQHGSTAQDSHSAAADVNPGEPYPVLLRPLMRMWEEGDRSPRDPSRPC